MDACVEKCFVRVDVANPGQNGLIKNRLLDRNGSALESRMKLHIGDRVFAGPFWTETKCFNGRGYMLARHQPIPAELPDIAEPDDGAVVEPQIEMSCLVRILAVRFRYRMARNRSATIGTNYGQLSRQ